MDAIKTAKVWIGERKGITSPLHVSQYDTAWTFQFKVYKDDLIYEPENAVSVVFTGKKSDDTVFAVPAGFEDGVATVVSTVAMTSAAGIVECELRFSEGGETVGTANFDMVVEPSPVEGGTPSESDFTTLQTMLDDMSEMYAETVDNAAAAAAAADSAAQEVLDEVPEMVSAWLEDNVSPETGYVIDSSLTVQGAAADAKATGEAVRQLKSIADNVGYNEVIAPPYEDNKWYLISGGVAASTGANLSGAKYCRTQYLDISGPVRIHLGLSDYAFCIWCYGDDTVASASHSETGAKYISADNDVYVMPYSTDAKFRIGLRRADEVNLTTDTTDPASDYSIIRAALKISRHETTDTTLSISGKAADAKATGDKISDIKAITEALSLVPGFTWAYNKIISASGEISDSNYYALSNIVECQQGDIFENKTPSRDASSGFSVYHVLYKTTNTLNDTFYQRTGASSTKKMVIPEGVTGYQFMFGRSTSDGVYISTGDAEANAVVDITRKGPSYDDLNTELKMLCIGNSFSQDSVTYMPYILNALTGRIKITVGVAYYGGAGIDDYIDFYDNDTASLTFNLKTPSKSKWSSTSNKTLKQILAAENWDIVTFQQKSTLQETWSSYSNLNSLIDKVVSYVSSTNGKSVRVGWFMPQIRKSTATADSYPNMISCVQNVLDTTPVDFVFPCGTAIQNARQTALNDIGDGGGLTYDGAHLQEGLPCLLGAYVSTLKVLELCGVGYKSIIGDLTRPTQDWITERSIPGQNGQSAGVTDANCYLAQKCAVAAMKKPFTVSVIA